MLYINFKRRQGRIAAIHTERCRNAGVWTFSDLKEPLRGYWLQVRDEEMAAVVVKDLRATPRYAGCCHRPGHGQNAAG